MLTAGCLVAVLVIYLNLEIVLGLFGFPWVLKQVTLYTKYHGWGCAWQLWYSGNERWYYRCFLFTIGDILKKAREIEIRLIIRLNKYKGDNKFGERLEELRMRYEQGLDQSVEFLK